MRAIALSKHPFVIKCWKGKGPFVAIFRENVHVAVDNVSVFKVAKCTRDACQRIRSKARARQAEYNEVTIVAVAFQELASFPRIKICLSLSSEQRRSNPIVMSLLFQAGKG